MTLEPVKATAEEGENHELTDVTRRFWVGSVLTVPVFVLEMGSHIPALGMLTTKLARCGPGRNRLEMNRAFRTAVFPFCLMHGPSA
jgi:hypothetical protein